MRRVKPVSFNENDKQEKELLEFCRDKTFSTYIKQLIFLDYKNKSLAHKTTQSHVEKELPSFEKESLNSFV